LHAPPNFGATQLHLIQDFFPREKTLIHRDHSMRSHRDELLGLDASGDRKLVLYRAVSKQGCELLLVGFECGFHLRKVFPAIVDAPNARLGRDVAKDALGGRVIAAAPLCQLRPDRPPNVVQRPVGDPAQRIELTFANAPRRERPSSSVWEEIAGAFW